MPSSVALGLCTVFVVFLLRLDLRQSPGMSRALWLPALWVIFCACKPLGDLFGLTRPAGGFDIEAGSPLDRTFSTILIVCSLLVLARRKLDRSKILKEIGR